jgi:hypothetical protein
MVNPLCQTYDSVTGGCTSCFVGYSLSGSFCLIASNVASKPKCSLVVKDVCTKCYNGYYLSGGSCLQVNALCKTYNATSGDCFSCYSGYYLEKGGCLVATLASLPGCVKLDAYGGCASCYSGYGVEKVDPSKKRRTCKTLNPLCKTYDDANGCASCYPGYSLQGIDCILKASNDPYCASLLNDKCLSCTTGHYLANNGTCLLSDPLCREVEGGSGRCRSCYPGYYLDSGKCLLPTASTLPFCDLSVGNKCVGCSAGYSLSQGSCKPASR